MIEGQTDSMDCGNTWSARYGYENNILKRLEIMRWLGYLEKEIGDYRQEALEIFSGKRELMQYLKKIRRYPGGKVKAAEIVENRKALDYRRSTVMDEPQKTRF